MNDPCSWIDQNTAVLAKWESANIDFIRFANKGVNHRHRKLRPGIPRDSLGLFSNLPGPLPITSCVKQVWLLLLADIFRRQNVEVQCSRGSFAFAWQKIEETPRPSAYNFDIQKVSRKTNSNSLYDRVKAPLRSSDYYHNHPLNSVEGTVVLFTQYQLTAKIMISSLWYQFKIMVLIEKTLLPSEFKVTTLIDSEYFRNFGQI